MQVVIVVSLTFVKDERSGHGGMEGSRIAKQPAEPASGGADFVEAEGTGAKAKLGAPLILEAFMPPWQPRID
jgi:hypothetical protein